MTRQSLFTIAPNAPFLATLADRVLDGTLLSGWPRHGPFWLNDVTIVLPTRRSRLALAEAFAQRLGGAALLPDIRTFGGEVRDEEPFLPHIDAPLPPPAVSQLERRLVLAELIAAWAQTSAGAEVLSAPPNPAEIMHLADSLGQLIDDLEIEGVTHKALRAIPPQSLAGNWQQTLAFLDIALTFWPRVVKSRGKEDAAPLRNQRLARQALAAPLLFGDRPVIAAGSTGSIPATASLLAALAKLPRGAIVLPGLDTTLTSSDHEALLAVEDAPHGHPQYGLAQLLRRLGKAAGAVVELAAAPAPRVAIVRRALALPEATARWSIDRHAIDAKTLQEATAGFAVLAARNEDEEARAIALAARDALAGGKTVGIVTPDRNLARRVAAELGRFGVAVDDAAGAPLFQSAAGRLLRAILAAAVDGFAPVGLMALLQNQGTRLGLPRIEVNRLADLIELGLLRGQRCAPGLQGLRQALAANIGRTAERVPRRLTTAEGIDLATLFDRLGAAIGPLRALFEGPALTAPQLAQALLNAFNAVTASIASEPPAHMPGLAELAHWARELISRPNDGPAFPPLALDATLSALMAGIDVPNRLARRDDIAIWGQLEARLQSPDLLIVAGLNEEVWPGPADPGPWLSRGMRIAAGLEPPERRQGQAAHDFEMALGNRNVIVAFSERLGTSPALPSRLVQRLEAFLGEAISGDLRARGKIWCDQARRLDAVTETRPAVRPLPRPPAVLRPKKLSVTEVEILFRSPYDLYARHVLKLRPLDPLGEEPGARERGSMIHDVLARFVIEGRSFAAPGALQSLNAMAAEAFAGLDAIAERRDIWLRRFAVAAESFIAFELERDGDVVSRHAEVPGDWTFPELQDFRLTGRADRVDLLVDGSLEIIDFKTGGIPQPRDMKNFDAPQLLLEAAMARAGALQGIAPAVASALTYIKLALGPDAFQPTAFKPGDGFDLMRAADEAARRMQGHIRALLLDDALPMAARVRPDVTRRYPGDYDHLARKDEWTLIEGDDEE